MKALDFAGSESLHLEVIHEASVKIVQFQLYSIWVISSTKSQFGANSLIFIHIFYQEGIYSVSALKMS